MDYDAPANPSYSGRKRSYTGYSKGGVQKKQRSDNATVMARQALSIAKKLRSDVELKHVTTGYSGLVSNTGIVQLISPVPEGLTYADRTGRKIRAQSIQIKGAATGNDVTLTDASICRILIVRDNGDSSGAPAISAILQASAVYGLREQGPHNLRRYSVLHDELFILNSGGPNSHVVNWYKKVNFDIYFDGNLAGDANKGSLYMILLSNRATDAPTMNLQTRVRYADA